MAKHLFFSKDLILNRRSCDDNVCCAARARRLPPPPAVWQRTSERGDRYLDNRQNLKPRFSQHFWGSNNQRAVSFGCLVGLNRLKWLWWQRRLGGRRGQRGMSWGTASEGVLKGSQDWWRLFELLEIERAKWRLSGRRWVREMWGVRRHRTGSNSLSSALLYVTFSASVAICCLPALCLVRLVCLVSAILTGV